MVVQNIAPEDAIVQHIAKLVHEATGGEINIYFGAELSTAATSDNIVCRIYKDRADHAGFGFQGHYSTTMIFKVELEGPKTEGAHQPPNEAISQYFKAIRKKIQASIVAEPANLAADVMWIHMRLTSSDNVPFESSQKVMNRVDIEVEAEFVEVST